MTPSAYSRAIYSGPARIAGGEVANRVPALRNLSNAVNQNETAQSNDDDAAQDALCKFRPFHIRLVLFSKPCSIVQSWRCVWLKGNQD
jgi:hypothetical protein